MDQHQTVVRACIGKHFQRIGRGAPTGHKIWHFLSAADWARLDTCITTTLTTGQQQQLDAALLGIGIHNHCTITCRPRTDNACTLILHQKHVVDFLRERESTKLMP